MPKVFRLCLCSLFFFCGGLLAYSFAPLQGILLLDSAKRVRKDGIEQIEGLRLDTLDLPGDAEELSSALSEFWGRQVTEADIAQIKRKIVLHYRLCNRPVVQIRTPQQDEASGVLQLVVYESRFGETKARGNSHFKTERLQGYIKAKRGDWIQSDSLERDVSWINRNPFRKTDLVLTPASEKGFTDIELVTEDRFPLRVFTGVDNTGVTPSDRSRWFAGFNWGNCFGLDHLLNYQFTSASRAADFWAHTCNYTALLPWRHSLDLYGGYSEVKACLPGLSRMKSEGRSAQASLRYGIPIYGLSILKEVSCGFDWKRSDTNLLDNEILLLGKTESLFQLVGGVEAKRDRNAVNLDVFWFPGNYKYARVSFSSHWDLAGRFSFEALLRAQASSGVLPSSEQFGLGGFSTIRGYEEREVNGDQAIAANVELKTPPFSILPDRARRRLRDEFRLLFFFDAGATEAHYLAGVGPGLRYSIPRYLTLRMDFGFRLKQLDFGGAASIGKFYFGLVLSV